MGVAQELETRLQSVYIEVKDLAEELERTEQHVLFDEQRLNLINDRLSLIYQLQKKHHVSSIEELLTIQQDLEEKLVKLTSSDEALSELREKTTQLQEESEQLATVLSESRKKAIPLVQKQVITVLKEVGMPNSILEIELQAAEQLRANGKDVVRFLFSANKGQAPQVLSKVASGGELSRLMLAIKSLIAQTSALPTIIFDEIDTGISGEVALQVGQVMEKMADHMQVIAITHLPQIASKGASHYKIYKADEGQQTRTNMRELTEEERILEIAQMLSGSDPGEAAKQHARELLKKV